MMSSFEWVISPLDIIAFAECGALEINDDIENI